ncbi:MAG: type VI secretion system contractile sheath small subunit [Campylobacter sp.]|nr:type VI secretion system contractile sheath small subunit [Campylobacter sp.]
MADGSLPPKERINISYKAKTNGQEADVELPLKLMVVANFSGENQTPLEDRKAITINKHNFNDVMQNMDIKKNFYVNNKLGIGKDEIDINLSFTSMQDFSPDSVAKQVPEIAKLIELRKALVALKGPMGNIPEFKKAILEAAKDKKAKKELLLEIKDAKNQ